MLGSDSCGTYNSDLIKDPVKDIIINLSKGELGKAIGSKSFRTYEAGGKIPHDRPNNSSNSPKWKMIVRHLIMHYFSRNQFILLLFSIESSLVNRIIFILMCRY